MATTRKWTQQGTTTTIGTNTDLASLAAGSLVAAASTFNNTQGQTNLDGYTRSYVRVTIPQNNYAANSTLDIWFLKQTGGTTEQGSASITPARPPDLSAALQTSTTNTDTIYDVYLPVGVIQPLYRNNQGSGSQALSGSGNSVVILPFTDQGV